MSLAEGRKSLFWGKDSRLSETQITEYSKSEFYFHTERAFKIIKLSQSMSLFKIRILNGN